MKRVQKCGLLLISVLGMAVLFGACAKKADAAIRVGSKNFTENLVLAELYALALEDAGIKIERRFDLASSVVHTALVNN
ncbi:MAG: hypothetical protein LBJ31_04080, partial [Treponema sp.]|nr:hypothetical protein [Treponema sp.]